MTCDFTMAELSACQNHIRDCENCQAWCMDGFAELPIAERIQYWNAGVRLGQIIDHNRTIDPEL